MYYIWSGFKSNLKINQETMKWLAKSEKEQNRTFISESCVFSAAMTEEENSAFIYACKNGQTFG